MRRVAVFVDAGYFWSQTIAVILNRKGTRDEVRLDHKAMRDAFLNKVEREFPHSILLRIYWYDGPGYNGVTQEHRIVGDLDDIKLRLGTRNSEGQQKAVDGLIIADMISLAQSKAISDALLVSGDADLTPGVVAAQAMGLRVHLLSINSTNATSPHLAMEADRKEVWNREVVMSFAFAAVEDATPTSDRILSERSSNDGVPTDFAGTAESVLEWARDAGFLSEEVVRNSTTLPRDIDRELLARGRSRAGRMLEEPEKRSLRGEFKRLLSETPIPQTERGLEVDGDRR